MKYNYQKIGDRIRDNRKSLEYSQDEFIRILKDEHQVRIGRNTLSNVENGNLSPEKFTMPLLIAICKIFNCDIGYLLGEYDENTRKEKVIQEELHLSSKAISTLKEIKFQSITQNPKILFTESKKTPPQNETFIHSLNIILEEYPELIAQIGRILLHDELNLYTDYIQRGSMRMHKTYDIDKPLLDLAIRLKHFVETNKKISTQRHYSKGCQRRRLCKSSGCTAENW